MGKALLTSGTINDGLKEQIIRMATDGIRKGIPTICLTDESGKRVARRGRELISRTLDLLRELSLELPEMLCFGVADWQKLRDITLTPKQIKMVSRFPWSEKTLNSPCPFHPNTGKLIRETHCAFVGLKHITIAEFQKRYLRSDRPRFCSYDDFFTEEKFVTSVTLEPRWHLVLTGIVPGSEGRRFDEQQVMLPPGYKVPSAVVEVAKDLFVFEKTGGHVHPDRYARTADFSESRGYRAMIGNRTANTADTTDDIDGIDIDLIPDNERRANLGVAAERELE